VIIPNLHSTFACQAVIRGNINHGRNQSRSIPTLYPTIPSEEFFSSLQATKKRPHEIKPFKEQKCEEYPHLFTLPLSAQKPW